MQLTYVHFKVWFEICYYFLTLSCATSANYVNFAVMLCTWLQFLIMLCPPHILKSDVRLKSYAFSHILSVFFFSYDLLQLSLLKLLIITNCSFLVVCLGTANYSFPVVYIGSQRFCYFVRLNFDSHNDSFLPFIPSHLVCYPSANWPVQCAHVKNYKHAIGKNNMFVICIYMLRA